MQPEVRTHDIETSRGVIHVVEAGAGPAFVMLHGGGPGASGYSNYKQNLPALTQHFRVLLIDQPGFGGSYRPDEALLDEFTITQLQAEGVIEVVRAPARQQPRWRNGAEGRTAGAGVGGAPRAHGTGWRLAADAHSPAHRGTEGHVPLLRR